ncbi:major facilitator superfamily domain-containing protein [Scleroderma yunnanense]
MSQLSSCILPSEHNPRQWSRWRRWAIALVVWNLIAPIDMAITFYSGVQQKIQDDLGTTHTLATLGVGLYNLGAMFGVLVGGPLSEHYGRRPVYIFSSICFFLFSLGAAVSPNITTMLLCRGFAGLLGSPVFVVYGGSLADLFSPHEYGPILALFTLVLQGAPTIGPVPSSFLGSFLHWRWLLGLLALWGGLLAALMFFVPETEPTAIARKLAMSQDYIRYTRASLADTPKPNLWSEVLLTPFTMLRHEPILSCTTIFHSFVYGLLFLLLEAYPHIYHFYYSMSREQSGLVFIAPFIGNVLGVLVYFGYLKSHYETPQRAMRVESNGGVELEFEPEARLPGALLASLLIPIGLFWFTLSADPHIHYILSVLSGVPVGAGMTLFQLSLFNYYIDLYPTKSASAIAANTAIRDIVATILPSITLPLYNAMGIRNANMMLACISCIGFPAGIILYVFGRRLRAASRWARQPDIFVSHPGVSAPLLAQGLENRYGGTSSSA